MLALITGAGGFVGTHLEYELRQRGHRVNAQTHRDLDVTKSGDVEKVIQQTRPAVIFHLAAQSSASRSWTEPQLTFETNVIGTHYLLETVRRHCPSARVMIAGTSDVYGASGTRQELITESDRLRPLSPYAASKLGQEAIAAMYREAFSIHTIVTRAFMHIGPGQPASFATADWARQIALAENGLAEAVLRVGDIEVIREFIDVRDVVRGYIDVTLRGSPGTVVNVASGNGYPLRRALEGLLALATVEMEVQIDRSRYRAADPRVLVGDPAALRKLIPWEPQFSLEASLSDVLNHWRSQVAL